MSAFFDMQFSDFITLQRGYDLPKDKFEDGPYPVVSSTSIMGYHKTFKIKAPGVVTGRSGTIGQVQYVTKDFWPHNTSLFVSDFKGNYELFVYYFLKFFDPSRARSGSAVPTLNRNNLAVINVSIPDLPTQIRIASILSAYDDLIEVNRKQIKLLEEAAERLYREWFIDLRFPGHETATFNADGLPEGWRKVPLDYVLEKITTGLNPRKNFVLGNGNNYYVTIKNMGNNNVYLDDRCDKVDDAALEKINKRSDLKTGDILFSGIGTIGRVYLISIPTNNWNVSESVFTMRANSNVTKEYLYMLLLSDDMQSYCDQNSHGAAQRGIRMADLKAYKMILPSDDVLRGFTNSVSPLIQKVQNLQHQINQAAAARDMLLPRLMNGEINL